MHAADKPVVRRPLPESNNIPARWHCQNRKRSPPESETGLQDRGITLRAVGMGVLVSALTSGWVAYSRTAADTSSVNITHLPVSFFGVFLVVLTINLILRSRPGSSGLGPSEMLTIIAMGLVAAMIPARGLTGIWLGLMAVPYYRSTPENGWIDYVQPSPPGLSVSNQRRQSDDPALRRPAGRRGDTLERLVPPAVLVAHAHSGRDSPFAPALR